jgi:hypothetical protein
MRFATLSVIAGLVVEKNSSRFLSSHPIWISSYKTCYVAFLLCLGASTCSLIRYYSGEPLSTESQGSRSQCPERFNARMGVGSNHGTIIHLRMRVFRVLATSIVPLYSFLSQYSINYNMTWRKHSHSYFTRNVEFQSTNTHFYRYQILELPWCWERHPAVFARRKIATGASQDGYRRMRQSIGEERSSNRDSGYVSV